MEIVNQSSSFLSVVKEKLNLIKSQVLDLKSVYAADLGHLEIEIDSCDDLNQIIIFSVFKSKFIYDENHLDFSNASKKKEFWTNLAKYFEEKYVVPVTDLQVEERWEKLKTFFINEDKKSKEQQQDSEWLYYKSMLFLQPYISSLSTLKSIKNVENELSTISPEVLTKQNGKQQIELGKKIIDTFSYLVFGLEAITDHLAYVEERLDEVKAHLEMDPYVLVICEAFQRVPDNRKTECLIRILEVIRSYSEREEEEHEAEE